ncbi:MAG: hypothetical protein HYZ49_21080 [Chloroflexi bacterium]|nr:hypothetical protein [Chloroflexota bacterium]
MNVHTSAFIHEKAIVESGARVGARTRVWAFAHVLAGAVIGDECNICDHVFIGKIRSLLCEHSLLLFLFITTKTRLSNYIECCTRLPSNTLI